VRFGLQVASCVPGLIWERRDRRYSVFAKRLPGDRTLRPKPSVVDPRSRPAPARVSERLGSLSDRGEGRSRSRKPNGSQPRDCAGAIDSLFEPLQGRFSRGVMARICRSRKASRCFSTIERSWRMTRTDQVARSGLSSSTCISAIARHPEEAVGLMASTWTERRSLLGKAGTTEIVW